MTTDPLESAVVAHRAAPGRAGDYAYSRPHTGIRDLGGKPKGDDA